MAQPATRFKLTRLRGNDVYAKCRRHTGGGVSNPSAAAWNASGWGGELQLARAPIGAQEGTTRAARELRRDAAVLDEELVFGLLESPDEATDGAWLTLAQYVLYQQSIWTVCLLPARVEHWTRARRLHRDLKMCVWSRRCLEPPQTRLAACDALVCTASESHPFMGSLSMLARHAHALGVPVVGGPALRRITSIPESALESCVASDAQSKSLGLCWLLSRLGHHPTKRDALGRLVAEAAAAPGGTPELADVLSEAWLG